MRRNITWMIIRLLLLASIGIALEACGTKGPLYIPEHQYPQTPATQ